MLLMDNPSDISFGSGECLIDIRSLSTHFFTRRGVVKVLEELNFHVGVGEIVGLVGESGSGKSVTGFSIMRLLRHPGRIVSGQLLIDDVDLLKLSEVEMAKRRGLQISMVFQNPRSSLNPLFSVGEQISDVLRHRRGLHRNEARNAVIEILHKVHIPDPEHRMRSYPHQLSGGMAQRVMIAMALSCGPRLLIADEPTTGLDVTIQYQIIQLLREMRDLTGTSVILITHDLNMAGSICDRICVMYAGEIVESAPIGHFFSSPRHPYTIGLLASRPQVVTQEDIETIPGVVPDLFSPPNGCRFHPRCRWAIEVCKNTHPELSFVGPGHYAACHRLEEVANDCAVTRQAP